MSVSSCRAALLRSFSASFLMVALGATRAALLTADASCSSGGEMAGTLCRTPGGGCRGRRGRTQGQYCFNTQLLQLSRGAHRSRDG